jgi:hypothetical protein
MIKKTIFSPVVKENAASGIPPASTSPYATIGQQNGNFSEISSTTFGFHKLIQKPKFEIKIR